MIRFIAAIDSKHGLANDHGIPWQGKVPSDAKYFRKQTLHQTVLMGAVTYQEFDQPLPDRKNLVLTREPGPLRPGFEKVTDLETTLAKERDLWIIGGAGVFAQTIDFADELYLTRLNKDFHCTKFFPDFEDTFELAETFPPITENGTTFHYETWKRKQPLN